MERDRPGNTRCWYRVEHRDAGGARLLAYVPDAFPHHDALTPFVSRLLRDGVATGEVVLVDDHTGAEVARRDLGRGLRRWRDREDR